MKRDIALRLLRDHEAELHKLGVAHAHLFGSVARDEAVEGSDVDVFITPAARPFTLIDLVRVKSFLEETVFHGDVDVFTLDGLQNAMPSIQQKINAEIAYAF